MLSLLCATKVAHLMPKEEGARGNILTPLFHGAWSSMGWGRVMSDSHLPSLDIFPILFSLELKPRCAPIFYLASRLIAGHRLPHGQIPMRWIWGPWVDDEALNALIACHLMGETLFSLEGIFRGFPFS